MYGFIYITTNLINNMKYIGQHKGDGSDNYLGSGDRLIKAIKKYGKKNFTRKILCFANSPEELNRLEKEYIEKYNAVESEEFYNIAYGGHVNPQYGEKNGMYGKTHTNEVKARISKKRKELFSDPNHYIHSHEFKNKMSEVTKGECNGMYGRKHTKEAREKMSINKKGKNCGSKNGNYGNKGEKAKNGRTVYQYKDKEHTILIQKYNTVTLAVESLGVKGTVQLNKAIKNNTLYKGYYWSK